MKYLARLEHLFNEKKLNKSLCNKLNVCHPPALVALPEAGKLRRLPASTFGGPPKAGKLGRNLSLFSICYDDSLRYSIAGLTGLRN